MNTILIIMNKLIVNRWYNFKNLMKKLKNYQKLFLKLIKGIIYNYIVYNFIWIKEK